MYIINKNPERAQLIHETTGDTFTARSLGDGHIYIDTILTGQAFIDEMQAYINTHEAKSPDEVKKDRWRARLNDITIQCSHHKDISKASPAIALMLSVLDEDYFDIDLCEENGNLIELTRWTDDGTDMTHSIRMKNETSYRPNLFWEEMWRNAAVFDPSEEAKLHMKDKRYATQHFMGEAVQEFISWRNTLEATVKNLDLCLEVLAKAGLRCVEFTWADVKRVWEYDLYRETST